MTARRGWAVILVSAIALTLVWRSSRGIAAHRCRAVHRQPVRDTRWDSGARHGIQDVPKAATFPPAEVYTNETPPQAQILMEAGVDSSTPVTLKITR